MDTITTLGSFNGMNGAYPTGDVVADSNGDLFGTTSGYGSHPGTLFEWVKSTGTITSLASLSGFTGPLAIDPSTGDIFGTTGGGDTNNDGTIFEWNPSASSFTTLAAFNGTNGSAPQGGLLRDAAGALAAAIRAEDESNARQTGFMRVMKRDEEDEDPDTTNLIRQMGLPVLRQLDPTAAEALAVSNKTP